MTTLQPAADKPRLSLFGPAPRAFSDWLLAKPALARVATAMCILAVLLGVVLPFDRVLQVGTGVALLLFTLVAFIYLLQRLSFSLRAETGARFVDAPKRGALLALVTAIFAPVFLFAAVSEGRNYLVFRSFASDELASVSNANAGITDYVDSSEMCIYGCAEQPSLETIHAIRREAVALQHAAVRAFLDQARDRSRLNPYTAWVLRGQVWERATSVRLALESAMQAREASLGPKEEQERSRSATDGLGYDAATVYFPTPDGRYEYDVACAHLSTSFCSLRDLNTQYGALFVDPGYDTGWSTWAEAEGSYISLIIAGAIALLFALALQFAVTLRIARLSENGALYSVYSLYVVVIAVFTAFVSAAIVLSEYSDWSSVWTNVFMIAAGWVVPALALGAIGPLRREPWRGYLFRQALIAMPGVVLTIITSIAALTMRSLVFADPQPAAAVLLSNGPVRFAIGAVVFAIVTWFLWGWLDRRLIEGNCRPRQTA